MTPYRSPDFYVEKYGIEIAAKTEELFEQEYKRAVERTYANKIWSPISIELYKAGIKEVLRIFNAKLVSHKETERLGAYRYQAQDKLYPESEHKEDLKKWYPV